MLLQNQNFFLFSLFIFSFISQLIWVRLGWNFHRWFSIQKQVNWCTYNWSFLFVVLHKPTLLPSTFKECLGTNCPFNRLGMCLITLSWRAVLTKRVKLLIHVELWRYSKYVNDEIIFNNDSLLNIWNTCIRKGKKKEWKQKGNFVCHGQCIGVPVAVTYFNLFKIKEYLVKWCFAKENKKRKEVCL